MKEIRRKEGRSFKDTREEERSTRTAGFYRLFPPVAGGHSHGLSVFGHRPPGQRNAFLRQLLRDGMVTISLL